MTQINLTLPDMVCGGCVKSVTRIAQKLDSGATVDADPTTHAACITTTAREADLREALARAGFPPA